MYLAAGVTTVRDMGNEFEFITALRDAVASHRALGPRILMAGLVDGGGPDAFGVYYAATPEDVNQVVGKYPRGRLPADQDLQPRHAVHRRSDLRRSAPARHDRDRSRPERDDDRTGCGGGNGITWRTLRFAARRI